MTTAPRPLVALLTDFGHRDPYVGIMKGTVLARCPETHFIDLTHDIDPGDIGAGSFWLEHCRNAMPKGTIFLAVVDPTVGTSRRALCLQVGPQLFVGPDNGLFEDVLRGAERRGEPTAVVEIDPTQLAPLMTPARGGTFHGRDVFAPGAGQLASGRAPVDLGWPLLPDSLHRERFALDLPHSIVVAGRDASVRITDHFGNLITDYPWTSSDDPGVHLAGGRLPWVHTYADAQAGRLFALRGSFDTIEIAMRGQSALKHLTS